VGKSEERSQDAEEEAVLMKRVSSPAVRRVIQGENALDANNECTFSGGLAQFLVPLTITRLGLRENRKL
jgi:hypothetical protein